MKMDPTKSPKRGVFPWVFVEIFSTWGGRFLGPAEVEINIADDFKRETCSQTFRFFKSSVASGEKITVQFESHAVNFQLLEVSNRVLVDAPL